MVDAVVLDLGNVLVFHDDDQLFARLSALGGVSPEAIRATLVDAWDPCYRGRLAGDELRRTVCAAAKVDLDPAAFREVWSCHFRFHDQVFPLVESLFGRV